MIYNGETCMLKASNRQQIIISADALSHPVPEQGIAEPDRAREVIANRIEQREAVYRDEKDTRPRLKETQGGAG